MKIANLVLCVLIFTLSGCFDKEPITIELRRTASGDFYVPANLEDCFRVLDESISESDIDRLRRGALGSTEMHFGLGMSLRNAWELWTGSRLSEYFNGLGIYHPDDMSSIILDSYISHVRELPIRLEEQVEFYIEYWREHSPPEDFVDPETGHIISRVENGVHKVTLEIAHTIHIGKDRVTGERWHYEYKRGWYRPTQSEIQAVEQFAAGNGR